MSITEKREDERQFEIAHTVNSCTFEEHVTTVWLFEGYNHSVCGEKSSVLHFLVTLLFHDATLVSLAPQLESR